MLTILGNTLTGLGLIADLHLAKTTGKPTSRITNILTKLTVEKTLAIAATLITLGLLYTLYLFTIWIQSGYRYLPLRGENALALTLIVLGAQTAATALTAHLIHAEQ
jgi:hypothetical protein